MKNNNIKTLGQLSKHTETELKNLGLNKDEINNMKSELNLLGTWLKNNYRSDENGSITRKLRASSKQRLKRHLKTLKKLRDKEIVDDDYVYIRKNAFYNHIKDTKESEKLKSKTFPKKIVKKKLL